MSARLVVMAHFDPAGEVAPHVRRHVQAWAGAADQLLVVTTSRLSRDAQTWLASHATVIERPNYGYDFLSYRTGLEQAGPLSRFDEVVLTNDSFVGPLRPYERIFAEMATRPVDLWGFTQSRRVAPHVQSFFVVFRRWVVASRAFTRFWSSMVPLSDRRQVIRRYEVGMSGGLLDAGFTMDRYFTENATDIAVARNRMRWWATRRPPGITPRTLRNGQFQQRAAEWWNPAIALADRALPDGRLPMVKIDTLRYDPYGLGADRLLSRCEQAFPDHFAGIRDYLKRTAEHYPVRAGEALLRTLPPLRAARALVGY